MSCPRFCLGVLSFDGFEPAKSERRIRIGILFPDPRSPTPEILILIRLVVSLPEASNPKKERKKKSDN